MRVEEIRVGDIVDIDYIEKFTKEHINEGKALVIWKGFNHQPLVRKLGTKTTVWACYEHIAKIVGHIDIEDYMDKALEQQPSEDKTERFIKHKIDYLEELASIETNEGRWREEEKYLYAISVLEEVVEYINTHGGEAE